MNRPDEKWVYGGAEDELNDLIINSYEIHRPYNRFFMKTKDRKVARDQDIKQLLNAVVCSLSEYKETPLNFDLESPESSHRLTLQALYILQPLYKHVHVFHKPPADKQKPPADKQSDFHRTPKRVYISFEQFLLQAADIRVKLIEGNIVTLIEKWKGAITTLLDKVGNPNADVVIYSDLYNNAAIVNTVSEIELLRKRLQLPVMELDADWDENAVDSAKDKIKNATLHKIEDKYTQRIIQLLCMLLNSIPPNAVRAFYINQYTETNWSEFEGSLLPANVPKWLFDDSYLSDTLLALNHKNGADLESIATELGLQKLQQIPLPILPFISPIEYSANITIQKIKKRISKLKSLIRTFNYKETERGQRVVPKGQLKSVTGGNYQTGPFALIRSNENYILCKILDKRDRGNILVQLNSRGLPPPQIYMKHALERYGPWFPKSLGQGAVEVRDLLNRIDNEWGFEQPRSAGATEGAGAAEGAPATEPTLTTERGWRFQFFPPHWIPGMKFSKSSKLGVFLGGEAFLVRRTAISMAGGEHYTTFDFIITPTTPKTPNELELLHQCTARLHSHFNSSTRFPTKTGMKIMRVNAIQKLRELREERSAARETFIWLDTENKRINDIALAKKFFGELDGEIDEILKKLPLDGSQLQNLVNLVKQLKDVEKPTAGNYDFSKPYWGEFEKELSAADIVIKKSSGDEKVLLQKTFRLFKVGLFKLKRGILFNYIALKEDENVGEGAEVLIQQSEELRLELMRVRERLENNASDMFRLSRLELENSMLLRPEDERSMSECIFLEYLAGAKQENTLYDSIPCIPFNEKKAQDRQQNGQTLLKDARSGKFLIHTNDPQDVESPGIWSPPNGPLDKYDSGSESYVFCLSVLKYLSCFELFIRGSQRNTTSSLPSSFLIKRERDILAFFRSTTALAFLLYDKYNAKMKAKSVIPVFPSYRKLFRILKRLEPKGGGAGYIRILSAGKDRSSDQIVQEIKTANRHCIVATSNIHELLMSYLKYDLGQGSTPPRNFGIYLEDRGEYGSIVDSSICDDMTDDRKVLCRELWWRSQLYMHGNRIYNRSFIITSKLNESVENAVKNTLVARFKKSADMTLKSLRLIAPESIFFATRLNNEFVKRKTFESTLLTYVKRGNEQVDSGQEIGHRLGLSCLYQQLIFSGRGGDSMNDVLKYMYTFE